MFLFALDLNPFFSRCSCAHACSAVRRSERTGCCPWKTLSATSTSQTPQLTRTAPLAAAASSHLFPPPPAASPQPSPPPVAHIAGLQQHKMRPPKVLKSRLGAFRIAAASPVKSAGTASSRPGCEPPLRCYPTGRSPPAHCCNSQSRLSNLEISLLNRKQHLN